ncbi:MAG TPA: NHLP bacteriocin export ABC transporter permease/ATPase subunit [Trichocoleus sp.]|jgi:ATP-binding cassette subfamily C protein
MMNATHLTSHSTSSLANVKQLKGNTPLWLNDPQLIWRVESGALAVFAVRISNGVLAGERHYLFTIYPGEALFGTAPLAVADQLGMVAIPLEPSELLPLPIDQLASEPDRPLPETFAIQAVIPSPSLPPAILALLDNWIHQLGRLSGFPQPKTASFVPQTHYVAPMQGQICESGANQVLWIRVQQGQALWMAYAEFVLDADSPCFPIGNGMYLEADEHLEFFSRPTAEVEHPDILWLGLAELHRYILRWIEWIKAAEAEAGFRRFQERQQLNQQVTQETIRHLAAILQPQQADDEFADTPLLIAAGAVGRALNVPIRPPMKSEDLKRVREPLEAIARASQLRMRRVLLRDQWWQKDGGPLLAYTRQDRQPVALLPISSCHYQLFNPIQAGLVGEAGLSGQGQFASGRTLVDAEVASTLDPVAFVFYRPLPSGNLKAWDLLKFALQGQKRDLLAIVFTGVAVTLLGMLVPQATAILIDQAIPYANTGLLTQIGLALLATAFGAACFQLAQAIASMRIETLSDASLQAAVWDRLLKLRTSFFQDYSIGDLNSRVSAISAIRRKLSGTVIQSLFSGFFSLLNLGLMFYYSPLLAVLALVVAIVILVFTMLSGVVLVQKQRPLMELEGDLFGTMVQLINGVPKLRIAAVEERAFAHWGRKYRQQLKLLLSTQQLEDSVSVFNTVMPTLTTIALFWLTSTLITPQQFISGTGFSVGTFLAFSTAFGIFISGATSLSNTLIEVLDIVPLWQRAKPILNEAPEVDQDKADPGKLSGELRVDHVTFRYREDGALTLEDVSIQAKPGEFIALVGPSGSGKSTVMRLLLGFETPASGTIYYDGQDLAGLDVSAVRRQLGVVLQNGRITAGSIFENIASGSLITLADAWEAAERAGFADDIRSFPMQMYTLVSEGGSNISGGQRQRLVIARALALNPHILLLDEATSALDNRTQAIVSESLDRLNVTRIVIAHRLSTIRHADRIYVMESGRVIQQGTFDELATTEGLFARLIARQMA